MGAITRNFANNILGSGQLDATDGVSGNVPAPNVNNESLDNITALPSSVGFGVKTVSSDPPSLNEGEIFFNSTDGVFKSLVSVKAWASASPVITARRTAASAGTQTANFIAGGFIPGFVASTEEYNGTGWSVGGDMPASSYAAFGAGTLTAGLVYGGSTDASGQEGITTTLEYDGSSWTAGGALSQKRWNSAAGAGTQTAALASSGYNDGNVTNSEEYNGTSWTAGNAIDEGKRGQGQCGTQTASVLFGGLNPGGSRVATVEEYNGTNYSSATSLPGNRSDMGASGTQTSALGYAGYVDPGRSNNAFSYDGTSWTAQPNLATAIDGGGGSRGGTSSAALSSTGTASPGLTKATEEFTSSATTITAGAWAAGANQNLNTYGRGGCGTTSAGLLFGGYQPSSQSRTETETYDGTSYSEVNDLSQGRRYVAGFGTQTAAVAAGGNIPPGRVTSVEEWDGSSWGTNPNSLPTAVHVLRGTGTATAGLVFGGNIGASGSTTANTQTFDGTTFSEVNNLNTARSGIGGAGTQTATIGYGGTHSVPAQILTNAESWDGSSWSNLSTPMLTPRNNMGAAGTNTAAMSYGGNSGTTGTQNADYQLYNGTTWVSQPSMAISRSYIAGFGVSTSAIGAGGYGSAINPDRTRTEEFTGETSAQIAKTIQSS